MDPAIAKALKVKSTGAKRNLKDVEYAIAEWDRESQRLQNYVAAGEEDQAHQQRKVVDEAAMMIPHGVNRLQVVTDELAQFLADHDAQLPKEDEAVVAANANLEQGRRYLKEHAQELMLQHATSTHQAAVKPQALGAAKAASTAQPSAIAKAAEDGDY